MNLILMKPLVRQPDGALDARVPELSMLQERYDRHLQNEITLACYSSQQFTRQGLPTISRSPSEEECLRKPAFLALLAKSKLGEFDFHHVLKCLFHQISMQRISAPIVTKLSLLSRRKFL